MIKGTKKAILQTFMTNLVLQGCGVLTGIISARLLKPEGRGELAIVMLWPTILAGLGLLGTNWALTREIAAHPEKEAELSRTAVVLAMLLGSLTMVLGFFLVPHFLPRDKQYLTGLSCLYLIWVLPNFFLLNLNALDHGRGNWARLNLMRICFPLFYVSLIIILFFLNIKQVAWVVFAMLASYGFSAFCRIWSLRQEIVRGHTSVKDLRIILGRSSHFFLAGIAAMMAIEIDKAVVIWFLPTKEVGLYTVALSVASLHASLGGALGLTTFSALATLMEQDQQRDYLTKVFRQAMLLYLVTAPLVALLAPLLIVPLYGPEFAPAVQVTVVLVLATTFYALGSIINEGLRGMGQVYAGMASQVFSCAVILVMAWILVPQFGLLGAIFAVVLAGLSQLLLLILSARLLLKIKLFQLWGLRFSEIKILYLNILYFIKNNFRLPLLL